MSENNYSFKSETTEDAGIAEDELNYEYELSENIIEDLIKYTRSRTVKNEQQFVLTLIGYISGHMESPKHFISGVLIATAGAGKSHVQNTATNLIDEDIMYEATTGSEKSIIYDDSWNESMVANLDELQKPSEDIIEILKSLHGGEDEEFRYKVTGGGEGADRDTDEIVKKAIPYWFLYAQYEPDFEMWDRLLKIPIHESSEKNEGVARTHWGHSHISFGDTDKEYMYDFDEGEKALRDHIRELPRNAFVHIPAGEGEFGGHSFFDEVKEIFDIDRSETNRVSKMIANLVRGSALLNHKHREKRKIQVGNDGVKEAIIAEPQDLANIMACRQVLMATTHQLDRKRRAICLAIEEVGGGAEKAAPIKSPEDRPGDPQSIMGYLRETNASFVKKSQIVDMLADLEDNGMVEKLEGAGKNGRNLYQFTSWSNLGKFEIDDGFKALFDGTIDPFEERPFIETARQINGELTPSASDFMTEEEVNSSTNSTEADGQATLGQTDDTVDLDLAPYEQAVYDMLKENLDGEKLTDLDEHDPSPRELLGLVPMGEPDDELETAGTILDPDHEVWLHGPDEWVETTQKAEQQIEKALRRLTKENVFKTSITKNRGGQPLEMRVTIEDLDNE